MMTLSTRILSSFRDINKSLLELKSAGQLCRRYASFITSKVHNPDEKIDFETSKNPEEWKFVTRLLPSRYIPDPVIKENYPSGWKPQSAESIKSPYFIRRSRNHMVPVYLQISLRGMRKLTYVRHVLGDIWLFSSDLKKYIEDRVNHEIGMRVDEVGCKITLRGDYVYYAQQFILEKGF